MCLVRWNSDEVSTIAHRGSTKRTIALTKNLAARGVVAVGGAVIFRITQARATRVSMRCGFHALLTHACLTS